MALAEESNDRLAAVLDARPDSIESFEEAYPIDVGFKLPVEHARGSTYLFTFKCFEDVIVNIGYDLAFADLSVVYDFRKGEVLDVAPDIPELAVTGRWMFSPYASRQIRESWKEPGDDHYRSDGGVVVYSWTGNGHDRSTNDDPGVTVVFSHDEVENLGFLIMRKLSMVAER